MNTNIVKQALVSKPAEGHILSKIGPKVRLSAAQTNGAFELFELSGPKSPLPHVHREHDECMYVLDGIYTFTFSGEKVEAKAGSVVFIPRGIPINFTHSEGARALLFVLPAYLESFFRELGEGIAAGHSELELRTELAGKYDTWPVK